MRASIRRQVRIDRSADDVWQIVGRADALHEWFPGVDACEVDGSTRRITVGTGITMDETILTNDPIQRRFQYRIDGPLFREHLGTIDVIDLGDGSTLVTYATDADPAAMALVISGGTGGALEELRRRLESDDRQGEH
ncbi:MAG: SRPBCC family protein [Acidimicrobiales bacterium]